MEYPSIPLGYTLGFVAAIYLCILLHEFGHSLAAKWCDGESDEILLWPLGGLAFCRVGYSALAHLITAAAGPFVTFLIWGSLALITPHLPEHLTTDFLIALQELNLFLLLFNLIPAFPMDGGRILRDTLWFIVGVHRACEVAFWLNRLLGIAMIVFGIYELFQNENFSMFIILGTFMLMSTPSVDSLIHDAYGNGQKFNIKDRIRRGSRKRAFTSAIHSVDPVHECATCHRTEQSHPELTFFYSTSGDSEDAEYCEEHLPKKPQ